MSNFGRGSPKKPCCKIISKSVWPFGRRSRLKQKVDNARTTDDRQRLISIVFKIPAGGRGGVGVWLGRFVLKNPSLKNKIEGVKVREDWLV